MFRLNESTATTREAWICYLLIKARTARLLLQAALWSLGCSNFDRFLHTASKLGPKLCSTIYTTIPPHPATP
jgi:hypothetical protein